MHRRALLVTFLTAPLAAEAQQAGNVPRIGHLLVLPWSCNRALPEAFRQRLRELGYVEGRNIVGVLGSWLNSWREIGDVERGMATISNSRDTTSGAGEPRSLRRADEQERDNDSAPTGAHLIARLLNGLVDPAAANSGPCLNTSSDVVRCDAFVHSSRLSGATVK